MVSLSVLDVFYSAVLKQLSVHLQNCCGFVAAGDHTWNFLMVQAHGAPTGGCCRSPPTSKTGQKISQQSNRSTCADQIPRAVNRSPFQHSRQWTYWTHLLALRNVPGLQHHAGVMATGGEAADARARARHAELSGICVVVAEQDGQRGDGASELPIGLSRVGAAMRWRSADPLRRHGSVGFS